MSCSADDLHIIRRALCRGRMGLGDQRVGKALRCLGPPQIVAIYGHLHSVTTAPQGVLHGDSWCRRTMGVHGLQAIGYQRLGDTWARSIVDQNIVWRLLLKSFKGAAHRIIAVCAAVKTAHRCRQLHNQVLIVGVMHQHHCIDVIMR